MPIPEALYEQVVNHARQTALLESTANLLHWDERCMMPAAGAEYRAEQLAYLSGEIHRRSTDATLAAWLDELAESSLMDDPHSGPAVVVRELRRTLIKQSRLPQSLVEELSRLTIEGQQTWAAARRDNDFASFRPVLERIVGLTRRKSECYGEGEHPYDSLLDDFEPGATTGEVSSALTGLASAIKPLVDKIAGSDGDGDAGILTRHFPAERQREFAEYVARELGFDFSRGRLDVTDHPFCNRIAPHDCRMTTRFNERFFNEAFFGVLHEAGHGMYEQGLPVSEYGLPTGAAVSLGIHESQSRLWENFVGRSHAFWRRHFLPASRAFPEALQGVSLDDLYAAVNVARPSLIRVEADEVTYNLHIVIRFELELDLVTGELPVSDLPDAWNHKYEERLGLTPPDDARGVLQDIHWSGGAIGYFATYALGNVYAAQFRQAAGRDLGDLEVMFARGEFQPLLAWLRTNIHAHGQTYPASDLVARVTGKPPSHEPLVEYLTGKFGALYG